MVSFLKNLAPTLGKPLVIVAISAHWEETVVTITSGATPALLYDYRGFPAAAYQIQYPAPGDPALAEKMHHWLINTCTNPELSVQERETKLIHWDQAPFTRYCHPREEH